MTHFVSLFNLLWLLQHCFFAVYDVSGAASDRNVVVLNDIHIDIMDYIVPASCNDTEFRQMWAEFEWENKVSCEKLVCWINSLLWKVNLLWEPLANEFL